MKLIGIFLGLSLSCLNFAFADENAHQKTGHKHMSQEEFKTAFQKCLQGKSGSERKNCLMNLRKAMKRDDFGRSGSASTEKE